MTLTALKHQPDRTRGTMYAAILNVVTNLVAIPLWGLHGAAVTTLVTEIALFSYWTVKVRPLAEGIGMVNSLMRCLVPVVIMAGVLLLMPPWSLWVRIALGAMIYGGMTWGFGAIRMRDAARMMRL